MGKLVQVETWLSLNPDHVTSVRTDGAGCYVEMVTGTRHLIGGTSAEDVANKLNGESPQ